MARRLIIVGSAVLLLVSLLVPAMAADNSIKRDINQTEQRIKALRADMASAENNASALAGQIDQTLVRMAALRAELDLAEQALAAVEQSIDDTQRQIDTTIVELVKTQNDIAETRTAITDSRDELQVQAAELYMRGGRPAPASVVFEMASVQDMAVGMEYAGEVVADNERLVDQLEVLRRQEERQAELIKAQQVALEEERTRLEGERVAADARRVEVADRTADVQAELTYQQGLLDQTEAEIAEIEGEIAAQEAEQARLEELLAAAQQKGGAAPGSLVWPAKGVMTSAFGNRVHPILGYARLHAGIDISAASGSAIYAAASGTVILAGWYGGYGNAVVIDHGGGVATLYGHQSKIAVRNGQSVTAGDVIGYVGSTGLSTGPHLHFEVRVNGKPVDPMQYF